MIAQACNVRVEFVRIQNRPSWITSRQWTASSLSGISWMNCPLKKQLSSRSTSSNAPGARRRFAEVWNYAPILKRFSRSKQIDCVSSSEFVYPHGVPLTAGPVVRGAD